MAVENVYTRNKKIFMGFSLVEGVFSFLCILGMIVPVASYNFSVFEETKESVKLLELWESKFEYGKSVVVGFFLMILSGVLFLPVTNFVQKNIWQEKLNLIKLFSVLGVIAFCVGVGLFFGLEEVYYDRDELNVEAGFYLTLIGGIFSFATNVLEMIILYSLIRGGVSEEQMEEETQSIDNFQQTAICSQKEETEGQSIEHNSTKNVEKSKEENLIKR